MTTVTVPGASNTYLANPYNTTFNLEVAQQISNLLFAENENDTLFVQYSDRDPAPVPAGDVGELAVTLAGASNVVVPAGYSFTSVDQTVAGPLTISGGGSLFVGNQSTTYYGAAASGMVSIAAGDGNDLIALPPGSTYVAALGNGNDTIFANGSGTVTSGDGSNIFFVGGAGTQNVVNSFGSSDTIVASLGSVTVSTYGANPLIFGGAGNLVYYGISPGDPTITGGTGSSAMETLFGGAGQSITYLDGSDTVPGSAILAAGGGNETLNAGGAQYGVQLAAGIGSVDMIGSQGNDTFYGGAGAATMTGNGGSDAFEFGKVAGQIGGVDIITDFNSNDTFVVVGYGANAAQNALDAATVTSGATTVKLSDETTITFQNETPGNIRNQSF